MTPDPTRSTTERQPRPGETCSCGRPAVVVFVTPRFGDVPACKR